MAQTGEQSTGRREDAAGANRGEASTGRGAWESLGAQHALGAALLVHTGAVFRLDLLPGTFSPPLFSRPAHRHQIRGEETDFARDDLVDEWNTQCSSHWDSLRHVRSDEGFFGGKPGNELGAEHLAEPGLVTRAVLADVVRWREAEGRPLDPRVGQPISASDLAGTLAAQNSRLEPGDVLLVRTGWVGWYRSAGIEARRRAASRSQLQAPGLVATRETADWLHNQGVVAVVADNPSVEAWPLRSGTDGTGETLHVLAMVRHGIIFGELWNLEELAADCAGERRWESMLVSAPLAFPGACAAPANAIAIR